MKGIKLFYDRNFFSFDLLKDSLIKLGLEKKRIKATIGNEYNDYRNSINVPSDKEILNNTINVIKEKKRLNPSQIIVIGIGGSNLGTKAIQEALLGKYSNKILYADSVDSKRIEFILNECNKLLKEGKKIILNIVSESGDTLETLANSEIFIEAIGKHYNDVL